MTRIVEHGTIQRTKKNRHRAQTGVKGRTVSQEQPEMRLRSTAPGNAQLRLKAQAPPAAQTPQPCMGAFTTAYTIPEYAVTDISPGYRQFRHRCFQVYWPIIDTASLLDLPIYFARPLSYQAGLRERD